MAFVFYLKSFNSNILVMIQSLGGNTLPQAFELAVQAKNNMIDVGKLALRPLMSVFPDLSNRASKEVVPSTSAPQSMYMYPRPQQVHSPPQSSLALEVSHMKNSLRTFSNEIVNMKRSQIPPARPPFQQNFQGTSPTYQQNQYASN